MIQINTADQNIWVREPLLAAELFEVKVKPQWYCTEFDHEGDKIIISFRLAPPCEGQEQVKNNAVKVEENPNPPKEDNSTVKHPKLERGPAMGRPMILKKK